MPRLKSLSEVVLATFGVIGVLAPEVPTTAQDLSPDSATILFDPEVPWPRSFSYQDGSTLVFYEPQIESWEEFEQPAARIAVAFSVNEAAAPALGALTVTAESEVSLEANQVQLSDFEIEGRFPALSLAESNALLARVRNLFPAELVVDLDRLTANLARTEAQSREPELNVEPPVIFVSRGPAILVLFDGEPILGPIPDTTLQFAVNTNWDLIFDPGTSTYYLLDEDVWFGAPDPGGPWTPAGALPASFSALPDNENWQTVRQNIPGERLPTDRMPTVHVSRIPAELIAIDGEPQPSRITGTSLEWITNTESTLFYHRSSDRYYYLVSGRWFSSQTLDNDTEWVFATPELPGDFLAIPADHPMGYVRPSIPYTPEAQEAVLRAQIPQKATAIRDEIEAPDVAYQGDPQFAPIDGTAMTYAVNTANDVLRVGDLYYLCFQGVWFASSAPEGPWELEDSIPDEIYTIPESSSVYHTTHVRVYETTPTYVVYGYTPGYYGVYVSYGAVTFGTGWYYPPYYYYNPVFYPYPIYYPYPRSYGMATYYNPYTGTFGHGASIYGPYGGISGAAAYNPTTGTYARSAAAWGPYDSRAFAEAYNPRTDTYARTRQGSNVYGSWGTSAVRREDDWIRTARVNTPTGGLATVRTSDGTGSFVGRTGDDIYAGRDGNVYRRTGDGWEQYGNGGWNPVDTAQVQARVNDARVGAGDLNGQQRAGTPRSAVDPATLGRLDEERAARAQANRQIQERGAWQRNGSARMGAGRVGGLRRR